jgi:NAD(P)-dependent dehydrogenase (short-subunit alcohol dehydrogenase family)
VGTLQGASVLVTGAASGIGRATALHLATLGAMLALVDRDDEALAAVATEVSEAGRGEIAALAIPGDVTDRAQVDHAVEQALKAFGTLSGAVNCAGVEGARARLIDQGDDDFDRVVSVNLRGTFLCLRRELAVMSSQGNGSIVNIASAAGLRPGPGMPVYAATKAAVVSLTRSAAQDHGPDGVRVNAVCPGSVRTPMTQRLRGPGADLVSMDAAPLRRSGRPEEIADVIAWLLSEASSYVTGAAIPVDGGLLC